MISFDKDRLTVGVNLENDGNYWVAKCPELGLVAAHQRKNVAWVRISRMVVSQLSYALNNDPAFSDLVPDEEANGTALATLRKARQAGVFMLCVQLAEYASFEVPELAAC